MDLFKTLGECLRPESSPLFSSKEELINRIAIVDIDQHKGITSQLMINSRDRNEREYCKYGDISKLRQSEEYKKAIERFS